MKQIKNIFKIFLISILVLSCTDEDKVLPVFTDYQGGAYLRTKEIKSGTFNFLDLANSTFVLDLELVTSEPVKSINTFISYTDNDSGNGDISVSEAPFQSFSPSEFNPVGTVSISSNDAIAALGIDMTKMSGGDAVNFRFEVEMVDGTKFSNGNSAANIGGGTYNSPFAYSATLVCPSDLAGTYTVVSNGTNTDGQPAAVNLPYTVTITENGTANYIISDGVAGVYIFWYSVYGYTFETEGNFVDACGTLSGTWLEAFGGAITLTGADNGDGTLSIHWENVYGDKCDAIYTKQ